MAFSIGPMLLVLAVIFIIPWAIVIGVAMLARKHFKAYMPFYIGGAFVFEILLFILLFGVV